jgi:subtilisin family serine protease
MVSPRLVRNALGFLLIITLWLGFQFASVAWSGGGPEQTIPPASLPSGSGEFVPGEILAKFKSGASPASVRAALSAQDARAAGEVPALGVQRLRVPEGRELAIIAALRHHPLVEYVEPNYIIRAILIPNDPYFSSQWGLTKIGALQAWDVSTGSPDLTIAIVDSGIDLDHRDLSGKIILGYDYVNEDWVPDDDYGHGTHVAGIAAAWTDNGQGVAGVSWGARLMALKVLDAEGNGTYADVASAVTYAADHGAQIINLSLGGDYDSLTLCDAVTYAHNAGCVVVAATGNNNGLVLYPAKYAEAFAVAATSSTDQRAWFSNYGPEVDVAAPGVDIYSTHFPYAHLTSICNDDDGDGYGLCTGTSMATPHVAGLAALIWSEYPSYTNDQVEGRIEMTAVDLGTPGWDQYYGHGRIDAQAALCTPDLGASPQNIAFLADDTIGPIPSSQAVSVLNTGCDLITWTAAISPSATTWLTATSLSGTAAKTAPGSISLSADKSGLDHGTYNAQLVISTTQTAVWGTPQTVDVKLVYMEKLYKMTLFPIFKNSAW